MKTQRKPVELEIPVLTCIITGKSRITSWAYLKNKPLDFPYNYISREARRLLHEGMTVDQVRKELKSNCKTAVSQRQLNHAMQINGRNVEVVS